MSDGPVALKDAGRGRPGTTTGEAGFEHVRAPFPPPGAILWTPRRPRAAAPPPSADGPYEIVIERPVLAGVRRHVSEDRRESRFGFLLGRLFRCPDSGVHYAVADRAIEAREAFSEEAPGAYLLRAWAEAQREYRRHPGVLLGWYHSHPLLGLLLSDGDLDANRRYFGEPWQCGLLLVPDEARPLGGVFRPGLVGGEGPPGRDPARFWELPLEGPDGARSPVDWTNYERAEGSTAETGAGAGRVGRREERGVPLVIPTETDESGPVPPRPRRLRWTTVAGILMGIAVLAALAALALVPGREPRGPMESLVRPARPGVAAELARFHGATGDLRRAIDRYGERAGDFDAGRIGCDLLTTGYAGVDRAFIRLATTRGELDPEAASSVADAFAAVSEEVDAVNRHFDSTRCPRPQ